MTASIEKYFPTEQLDCVAERESWRKEVYRPNYHIHKWWAHRLGSVFRAMVIGALSEEEQSIWEQYYHFHDFKGKVVLDPFMGSGTTLGEALKLGATVVGCDINPVSTFMVTQGVTQVDSKRLKTEFEAVCSDVRVEVNDLYTTIDPISKKEIPVLYFFWVKVVKDQAGIEIPLFSSYIFSKDAYPKKKPAAKAICPNCWDILELRYDCTTAICPNCTHEFNPQNGPVSRQVIQTSTGKKEKIKSLIANTNCPPEHKLYAIMAIGSDGNKIYLKPSQSDLDKYQEASRRLASSPNLPLPKMPVREGHNTNQARGYNYKEWREFFNDRQLLTLGLLLKRILQVDDRTIKHHLLCLFSSTLEFNNLFCSFKGEGTGAVRHMFSNHILKPEKAPLENTVLGFARASGTFSSLFKSRLLKAKEYINSPFELYIDDSGKSSKKVCSPPLAPQLASSWEELEDNGALILNRDSSSLPLPANSVDAIVTDPPYFDFVHYSELSDFFYAWLSVALGDELDYFSFPNSGRDGEVQNKVEDTFSENLCKVWKEGYRVLKDDGILTFSFHHSKPSGWLATFRALKKADFFILAAHPIKAEMSGGSPKSAATSPINIDALLVCKKDQDRSSRSFDIYKEVLRRAKEDVQCILDAGRKLSTGDVFVLHASKALVCACELGLDEDELKRVLQDLYDTLNAR